MEPQLQQAVIDVIKDIKQSEQYINYIKAYELIEKNTTIQTLIDTYKLEQKNLVNLEHIGKTEAIIAQNQRLQTIEQQLEAIPVYVQFQQYQDDLEYYLEQFGEAITLALDI